LGKKRSKRGGTSKEKKAGPSGDEPKAGGLSTIKNDHSLETTTREF